MVDDLPLNIAVEHTLRQHIAQDWRFWRTITAPPDLILMSPAGQLHLLQFQLDGLLSEAREKFLLQFLRAGKSRSTARSIDEAIAALTHWGALKPQTELVGRP